MRKIALTLLLVFAAVIWSCEDGVDERASLGTTYVSASTPSGIINVDLYGGYSFPDPINRDNTTCVALVIVNSTTPVTFTLTPNPTSTAGIGRVAIKQVKVSYTGIEENGMFPPTVDDSTINTHIPLYGEGFESSLSAYQITANIPIFSRNNLHVLADFYTLHNIAPTYTVSFKFKLIELTTGIEEELDGGTVVIQAYDNYDLPEGQACTDY
jgi:hypothetical protein